MAGSVVLTPTSVQVVPGQPGTISVRIRNTGAVVDQFSVTVLGQPAVWTTAVPASLSLFPGADGTIELHFAPPRSPDVGSGDVPFGVRIDASQDPDGSVVEEGEVHLLPFVDVQAKLTPRNSETKRKARHEVIVDNRGNADIEADLQASDPDEHLAFELPRTLVVPAGQSAHTLVKVAAVKGFMKGPDRQRPFQVKVTTPGEAYPITLDGAVLQKSGMPKFLFPLAAVIIAVALIAVLVPAFKKDPQSGKLSLTADSSATTTSAPPAAPEAAPDPNAPATPEEAAAAAEAEKAANGKDAAPEPAGSGGSSGGSTAAAGAGAAAPAASGGGSSPATTVASGNESSSVTSPTATTAAPPPGGATTTISPTTTTAAPAKQYQRFVGSWFSKASGTSLDVSEAKGSLIFVFSGGVNGKASATQADAEDGTVIVNPDGVARTMTIQKDPSTMTMTTGSGRLLRSETFFRQ